MMILVAAALAAAAPAAPAQHDAQHDQHMPADHATMDCCKDVDAAEKAKCCADRAAAHAEHHQQ